MSPPVASERARAALALGQATGLVALVVDNLREAAEAATGYRDVNELLDVFSEGCGLGDVEAAAKVPGWAELSAWHEELCSFGELRAAAEAIIQRWTAAS